MNQFSGRRKNPRLKGFDYSRLGFYFVTLCTHHKRPTLASIQDGEVILTACGKIVRNEWFRTAFLRPQIELLPEEFVIMPNHLHAIIRVLLDDPKFLHLGTVIGQFKVATTKWIRRTLNTPSQRIWQRNYYEHIIRNDEDLDRIQAYIRNNPLQWELDRYYVSNL